MGRSEGADRLEYDDYVRLIQQVDELVAGFDDAPEEVRERVVALLTGVDLLHRTALRRLVHGLREHGAGPALEGVRRDRIVETLLGLYDLAELAVPDEVPGTRPASGFVPRESLTLGRRGARSG